MLLLVGVDMDTSTPADWLAQAHAAARFVTGVCCAASPPPPWPRQQQQTQQDQLPHQHGPDAAHQPQAAGVLLGQPVHDAADGGAAAGGSMGKRRGRPRRNAEAAVLEAAALASTQESPQHTRAVAALWQPSPVAVRRWVLTQKVLVEQRRLSGAHFRYLTMLGARRCSAGGAVQHLQSACQDYAPCCSQFL